MAHAADGDQLHPPGRGLGLRAGVRLGFAGGAGGCLLYTSDAADERSSVDLGGRRIIKKKNKTKCQQCAERDNRPTKK